MFRHNDVQILLGQGKTAEGWPAEVVAAIYPSVTYDNMDQPASVVRCPFIFRYDRMIAGSDERDALKNARAFIIDVFEKRSISYGKPTSLEEFLASGGFLPWEDDDPELDASNSSFVPSWLSPVHVIPPEPPISILTARKASVMSDVVTGKVFRARFDDEVGCWGSVVDCPVLRHPVTKIFGVDGAQAQELGEQFIRTLFEYHGYRIADVRRGGYLE